MAASGGGAASGCAGAVAAAGTVARVPPARWAASVGRTIRTALCAAFWTRALGAAILGATVIAARRGAGFAAVIAAIFAAGFWAGFWAVLPGL